jgi:hypothetical protein
MFFLMLVLPDDFGHDSCKICLRRFSLFRLHIFGLDRSSRSLNNRLSGDHFLFGLD